MNPKEGETYWQPGQDEELPLGAEEHQDNSAEEFDDEPLTWQASEYVQHDKQVLWYVALVAVAAMLFLVSVFLIKSWSFAILVVVLAGIVGFMAGRPPRLVHYTLSPDGLTIDEKTFTYHDFRAFGVIQDGPIHSIVLIPNKRFMPAVNVYFPPEQGEEIVDLFGAFLPMEHVEPDFVEKIARKIRF